MQTFFSDARSASNHTVLWYQYYPNRLRVCKIPEAKVNVVVWDITVSSEDLTIQIASFSSRHQHASDYP